MGDDRHDQDRPQNVAERLGDQQVTAVPAHPLDARPVQIYAACTLASALTSRCSPTR